MTIEIDEDASPYVRANAEAWLNSAAQSDEGASALMQLMTSSNVHLITSFSDPSNPRSERTTQTSPDAFNGKGSGSIIEKMTLQTNPVEHTRLDGTKETLSPEVMAAHEAPHGAAIVTGTQAPPNALLPATGPDYIKQPSEVNAVKGEDAQRKREGLLPRDR
jgi:hypothetical protein